MTNPLSSSSHVSSPSEPWILESFKIDDSLEAPKAVLDYLRNHPELVNARQVQTQKALARLRAIDLAKAGLSSSHWKVYAHYQSKFPKPDPDTLSKFPEITLRINERTLKVEKNRLIQRSEVLQRQAALNPSDAINLDVIDINWSEAAVTLETKKAFLLYLQSGVLDLESSDPFELLKLADKYAVEELKEELTRTLNEALSDESVLDILEASKAYSAKILTGYCMFYAFKNLDTLLVKFPEKAEMLQPLKTLREMRGALNICNFTDLIEISFNDWSIDHSKLINDMCRWAELRLNLIYTDHDDQSLKVLLLNIPNLNHLFIRNSRIKRIEGAEKLKTLNCMHCSSLSSLNVPTMVKLSCGYCPSLSSLNAPAVTELSCEGCLLLSTLIAPAVTRLNCKGCRSLSTLFVPEVIKLTCFRCSSLTALNAPEATAISCAGCTSLSSLNAPAATELLCDDCPSLHKDKVHVAKDCKITGFY